MNRSKAAGIHLICSAVVLFTVYLLIAYVWYPHQLFSLAAGAELLRLIVGVDLVIGPLVMFIIFDAKKKLIKLDVAIILIFQIGFMSYGLLTMYSARPAFLVFAENHFYLVRANEIDQKDLDASSDKQFAKLPWFGPVYVGCSDPKDPKEIDAITTAFLGGMGIQNLPKYFIDYQKAAKAVVSAGKSSKDLGVDFDTRQRVKEYELKHTTRPVLFLPMVNKTTPLIVVVDAKSGEVVDLI